MELQERIVEPLLKASGFEQVRDVSGPNEKGKDLVATKSELGISHFYAIQIKKIKITGRARDVDKSLMGLIIQLKQAITEPIFDPFTRTSRTPDRLIFITPFVIDRPTLESAMQQQVELSKNQVTILDGGLLTEQAGKLLPHELAGLRDDIGYRLQVVRDFDRVEESRAFGIRDELSLDRIFVEVDYSCLDVLRDFLLVLQEDVAGPPPPPPNTGLRELEKSREGWSFEPLGSNELLALEQISSRWPDANVEQRQQTESPYTLQGFLSGLLRGSVEVVDDLAALESSELDRGRSRAIWQRLSAFQRAMNHALNLAFLRKRQIEMTEEELDLLHSCTAILNKPQRTTSYRNLSRIHGVVVVAGEAGAGKTTLMRMIVRQVAQERPDLTPVFVRAVDIRDVSTAGVLGAIAGEMSTRGNSVEVDSLIEVMNSGQLLWVVDGLDEAGDRLKRLRVVLRDVVTTYPSCPLFVSCRINVLPILDWTDAVHVSLPDFDQHQLEQFVSNWFATRPSLVKAMKDQLERLPQVSKIARRPIIAALLCSLFDANDLIPTTEVELYSDRSELLLGRWEQAKGITPMRQDYRDRYLQFLMKLAYKIHSQEVRSFPYSELMKLAPHYYTPAWNRSVSGFIEDCVSRSLLYYERHEIYSFGHLTYQEYFAAKYLAHHNDVGDIAKKLGVPWWRKTLEFYAAIQKDITPLMRLAPSESLSKEQRQHLSLLREFAPLTRRNRF